MMAATTAGVSGYHAILSLKTMDLAIQLLYGQNIRLLVRGKSSSSDEL